MTIWKPKMIQPLPGRFSPGASWCCTGLLLACCTFLLLGCGGDSESREVKALKSDDPATRMAALNKLQDMGDKASAPKAVELLKDKDPDVRRTATALIVKLKHNTPEVLKILSDIVANTDDDQNVRTTALHALLDLGAHKEFIEQCKKILAGSETGLRQAASMYLGEAGEHASGAQTELIAGLKDADTGIKMGCIVALGNLGSKASDETKAALGSAAKDANKNVAKMAKDALKKLKK